MKHRLSNLFSPFKNKKSVTFVKDIKTRALNVTIDSDVILKTGSGSFSFLSEYMKVDRGILDLISFFRAQISINAHIFTPSRTDTVGVLDSVMSTGFTVNSCICENKLSSLGKDPSSGKIPALVKILSSFPTGRYIFFLSGIEELVFLEYLLELIKNKNNSSSDSGSSSKESKLVSFIKTTSMYSRWSSCINLAKLEELNFSVDAIFLKSESLSDFKKTHSFILSNSSKVCLFDNYLDVVMSLVISKILSKDKFISFLKYSHDHFGESIEDILSVIKPVEDLKLINPEDTAIFKNQKDKLSSYREKQISIKNYTIEDSSDFSEEFIRIYLQEYKQLS